jgi:2'-5' RNA ligase
VDAVTQYPSPPPQHPSPKPAASPDTRRLVVVLALKPLTVGDTFLVQDWPLHITVLAPFLTEADLADLRAGLERGASTTASFPVVVGRDDMFGRRHNIPVSLIEDNETLTRLRQSLITAVRPFAADPEEAAFTGTTFRPHITMKPPGRVYDGDRLTLSQIALVDMAPRADARGRTVLATADLGD